MGRPKDTPLVRDLKAARKTLAKIEALDPSLDNRWVAGMVRHWRAEVAALEAAVQATKTVHG